MTTGTPKPAAGIAAAWRQFRRSWKVERTPSGALGMAIHCVPGSSRHDGPRFDGWNCSCGAQLAKADRGRAVVVSRAAMGEML